MDKYLPEKFKNLDSWKLSRRKFLKGMALAGIASQVQFLGSCWGEEDKTNQIILSQNSEKTLAAIQQILFPNDGFGPDAKAIHALKYFKWVLTDKQMDEEDKKFILNGIEWTSELTQKEHSKYYFELNTKEQKMMVIKMSNLDWGETWLSIIMTFILEALLSNPLYGGNPNEEGWKWLNHYQSGPQPTKELLYPQIFNELEKNI